MRYRNTGPVSVKWIRGGLIILGIGIILLAGAFIAVGFIRSRNDQAKPDGTEGDTGNPAQQVKVKLNTIVLQADANITYEYHYLSCGHVKTETKAASPAMVGMSEDEIARTNPDMQIIDFTPDAFKAVITLDLYCPDHFILKAVDGMVDIYQTNQATGTIELNRKISIPLGEFDADRTEEISNGMPFDSIEKVEEFLDDQEV